MVLHSIYVNFFCIKDHKSIGFKDFFVVVFTKSVKNHGGRSHFFTPKNIFCGL